MLQAAINIDSLMHRRRCTAELSQLLSTGPAHHRSIAKPAIADDPDLCLPHLRSTPPLVGSRPNIAMALDAEKLEWFGYPMLKRYRSILYRFSVI